MFLWCLVFAAGTVAGDEPGMLPAERAYRQALWAWAQDEPDAVAGLVDLSRAVVDQQAGFVVHDGNVGAFHRLDDGRLAIPGLGCSSVLERATASVLVLRQPETFDALFALVLEALRETADAPGRLWLASRFDVRVRWLLGRHRDWRPDATAERASLNMAYGTTLMGSARFDAVETAAERFERASLLAPDDPAARYWAGVASERIGDLRTAHRHFARLLRVRPDDTEARLRLGVVLQRLGRDKAARQGLRSVATGDGPDWLRILAYHRLAGGRDAATARDVLEEALARFPRQRQLVLQWATLVEGDWPAVDRALDRLESGEVGGGPTPWLRYEMPRADGLAAHLEPLRARTAVSRRAIAQVLEALDHEEIVLLEEDDPDCRSVVLPNRVVSPPRASGR